MRQVFNPQGVSAPGGAYSQVVRVGDLVFLAGVAGQDQQHRLAGDGLATQSRQALANLRTSLAVDGTLADVCYVTAFLEHPTATSPPTTPHRRSPFPPTRRPARPCRCTSRGRVSSSIQAIAVLGSGAMESS
jgi:enamine deaminase RidA (YjgF/YER057c/UK114 family)